MFIVISTMEIFTNTDFIPTRLVGYGYVFYSNCLHGYSQHFLLSGHGSDNQSNVHVRENSQQNEIQVGLSVV